MNINIFSIFEVIPIDKVLVMGLRSTAQAYLCACILRSGGDDRVISISKDETGMTEAEYNGAIEALKKSGVLHAVKNNAGGHNVKLDRDLLSKIVVEGIYD